MAWCVRFLRSADNPKNSSLNFIANGSRHKMRLKFLHGLEYHKKFGKDHINVRVLLCIYVLASENVLE